MKINQFKKTGNKKAKKKKNTKKKQNEKTSAGMNTKGPECT